MAKKRKKKDEKKEEPGWDMPEFNETEYINEQLSIGKGVLISAVYALVPTIISFVIIMFFGEVKANYFFITLAVAIILMFGLYFILPKFGIKLMEMEKKSWFNFIAVYMLTWLGIFVLVLNPPFSDFTDPLITDQTHDIQEFPIDPDYHGVRVELDIRDNYKVEEKDISCEITYPPELGTVLDQMDGEQKEEVEDNLHIWYIPYKDLEIINQTLNKGDNSFVTFTYSVDVKDIRGNSNGRNGSFRLYLDNKKPFDYQDISQVQLDSDQQIWVKMSDNAAIRKVWWVDKNDTEGEEHNFVYNSRENKWEFSLSKTEKGFYDVDIFFEDMGGNGVKETFSFNMKKDGSKVGEGGGGLFNAPGMEPAIIFLAVAIVFSVYYVKKRPQ